MIQVKVFVFNPFQENTYLLYDETGECIIIDPGCATLEEELKLNGFINAQNLVPVALINTHTHIDHILGNNFIGNTYRLKPLIHPAGEIFLQHAPEHGKLFGFNVPEMIRPEKYVKEGDHINFGNSVLEVLYTPGHVDGSICLVSHSDRFVITGDVLFNGSIGRTDLPTGNFEILEESITTKLYALPDDYTVYPGHGPATTIGDEKSGNLFVRG